MAVDGKALAAAGVGVLLVWSGIKGWSVLGTITDVISGKKPQQAALPLTVADASVAGATSGVVATATGANLAGIALQYAGHAYSFGGAPGKDGSKPWDCSSFVNYVASVKTGRAIPGYGPGKYDGSSHGPPTGAWATWPGTTRINRADVQAGDIIVWFGHMGIATANNQMISAQNPSDGTRVSAIDGFGSGPVMRYGRFA